MIPIDTKEKLDWLLNALENNELVLDNRELTDDDCEEIRREIAEYRAARAKADKQTVRKSNPPTRLPKRTATPQVAYA